MKPIKTKSMKSKLYLFGLLCLGIVACQNNSKTTENSKTTAKELKTYAQTTDLPEGLHTPDLVETSIGTLNFMDGAPLP